MKPSSLLALVFLLSQVISTIASPDAAAQILFSAEGLQTPADVGFCEINNSTSGQHAINGLRIPALGQWVWEVEATSYAGGYIRDISIESDFDEGFVLSAYIRGLIVDSQSVAIGNLERNRPNLLSFPGIPTEFILTPGQWYFLEITRQPRAEIFDRTIYEVNHETGALIFRASDIGLPAIYAGSPGQDQKPNSFAFYMANIGSSFIRTQFDNVRFEILPDPNRVCDKGDFTNDQIVSAEDIVGFVTVLLDPSAATTDERCRANMNSDSAVNSHDIQAFLECLVNNDCP